MAIYHLSASIIGRSDGRSAVAASAYRAGADMTDPDTGTRHDYTRKRGVRATFMELPEGAPDWAADRPTLWNAVHAKETRKNSRLSREIRVALPAELDAEAQARLVRTWARDHLAAAGIVADIAIHEPSREGDDRNTHAHIMTTLRRFDGATVDGWAKGAARDLNDKAFLENLRASWRPPRTPHWRPPGQPHGLTTAPLPHSVKTPWPQVMTCWPPSSTDRRNLTWACQPKRLTAGQGVRSATGAGPWRRSGRPAIGS